jgi:hypothetical protein
MPQGEAFTKLSFWAQRSSERSDILIHGCERGAKPGHMDSSLRSE